MIDIDFENNVYTCPYCGCKQSYELYSNTNNYTVGIRIGSEHRDYDYDFKTIMCTNKKCRKTIVVAIKKLTGEQHDILPEVTYMQLPKYIPLAIRDDYKEASLIIEKSPKASATLLRRCLQGMIRDFWDIRGENLYNEINALKDKVSPHQWKAIDGLRKIGNIGAHMEKDVNLIIDIDSGEAKKLQKLIEVLIKQWYISRHEEQQLYDDIINISDEKQTVKKFGGEK